MTYEPSGWYWIVGGNETKVWSSAKADYVPVSDADYAAFLAAGNGFASIDTLDDLKAVFEQQYPGGMLLTYAADRRYAKEIGGIVASGIPIATDDRSKQMIMGARIAAEADSGFTTPWVGSDGSIHTLNAAQVIAISNAVLAHVASCFATFATLAAGIAGATITSREQIDAAFA